MPASVEMPDLRALRAACPYEQACSDDEERQREELAHGDEAEEVSELRIGNAHELDEEAEDAVEHEERADEGALRACGDAAREREEDEEDHDALEQGLVELGGVAVHAAARLEHDAPGEVRLLAPELAVDEVGAAAEEEAERGAADHEVAEGREGDPERADDDVAADDGAHEPAMEAHAPLVEHDDLERVLQVVARAVEDDVAQTPADDDAEGDGEHDRVDVVARQVELPALGVGVCDEAGADEARQIGEAVPAHLDRSEGECDGVERMVEFVKPHGFGVLDGRLDPRDTRHVLDEDALDAIAHVECGERASCAGALHLEGHDALVADIDEGEVAAVRLEALADDVDGGFEKLAVDCH